MRCLFFLLCFCLPCPAQIQGIGSGRQDQQQQQPSGSISGSVVDAAKGEPVAGATVTVQALGPGGMVSASADPAGQFSAANLKPGQYYVQANHQSYPGALGLPQAGLLVDVESGKATTGVVVKLTPAGTVSGRILSDDGEPLPDCGVFLSAAPIGTVPIRQNNYAQSNEDGEFRIAPVAPDRYLLAVRCSQALPVERLLDVVGPGGLEPGAGWQPIYYPDSPTAAGASTVNVVPGANVEVELRAKPQLVTTVTGVVIAPDGSPPADGYHVMLYPEESAADRGSNFGSAAAGKSGRFRIPMVPPGAYRFKAVPFRGGSQPAWYASQRITVGQTAPPPVTLQLQTSIALTGKVEEPPSEAAGNGQAAVRMRVGPMGGPSGQQPVRGSIMLSEAGPSQNLESHSTQVSAADGTFQLEGITPGRWRVQYQSYQRPAWIESMQYGDTLVEGDVIEIVQGSTGTLLLRTGTKAPEVHYELKGAPPQAKTYWMIQAVPADGGGPRGTSIIGVVVPGQPVQARPLGPGRYSFFAVEQGAGGGMINERVNELLRREVKPVELSAGQEQTVQIRCFPTDELLKIVANFVAGEAR
ncbi:carboxypeptidase-like regulatory domain-containing protein [Paludibaculum fermentans]|uniref:Carboxypeptidase regulatory-like domain-containing protein n=1 Tax=Paludibaculum fermentans TaxID=1473598 RepID=A0A7S7SKU8_PALFE|nr:carboxypeptidase-like regulatory domain-containing protein [Paludibaculum fermentans]QOY88103.1 carboxypeptidase regulatory-like domain-containing protein [Paludibaculum fermentans]